MLSYVDGLRTSPRVDGSYPCRPLGHESPFAFGGIESDWR